MNNYVETITLFNKKKYYAFISTNTVKISINDISTLNALLC